MAKKPPVVWHLDTEGIHDFRYNPMDRLTMIKRIVQCAQHETSEMNVEKAIRAIERVCENNLTPAQLRQFLENNKCPDIDNEEYSENQEGE